MGDVAGTSSTVVKPRAFSAVASIVILALFACIYAIQTQIDEVYGDYRATEEILYVDDGKMLKKFLIGFENVAADIYWLRTVQYFGGKRLQVANKNYALLYPLLRITIDLDPNFKIAYTYGATFLAEPFPMGAAEPMRAIEIIDEGIKNHPDYWRFYLDKGFIYYWQLQDYEKAAEIFLEGSKIDGAPYWMVTTAARVLTRGGARDLARMLWEIQYETAETEQQKGNAETHLLQLDALDQLDDLTALAEKFEKNTGHYPRSWQELIGKGYLKSVPTDPTGVPYHLDPLAGSVSISESSRLRGIPTR